MEKINVAELLKDCPKGMELDCTMWDNVTFVRVDMSRKFPIEIAISGIRSKYLTKEGCFHDIALSPESKCVIFPKGKTTWEGFVPPYQFKDGDVITCNNGACTFISIFKEKHTEKTFEYYCCFILGYNNFIRGIMHGDYANPRFATEEEKQKLFQAIKDNGYKWNEKTKTLEKLIEPKFKDGEIVATDLGSVFILKSCLEDKIHYHSYIGVTCCNAFQEKQIPFAYKYACHLATEEEKAKLFQAIKENGYKWNAETKTLEELPKFKVGDRVRHKNDKIIFAITGIKDDYYFVQFYNIKKCDYQNEKISFKDQDKYELASHKFDINTLVPFESRVLMRSSNAREWTGTIFSHYSNNKFYGCGMCCDQCIPYEGNEHLLGKTDDCDRFYKTWE